MPRPTIKQLEDQIENLRELREGDRDQIRNLTQVSLDKQERVNQLSAQLAEMNRDKQWMKQLIQDLSAAIRVRS